MVQKTKTRASHLNAWRQILLIEDDSARSIVRSSKNIGRSTKAPVTVRIHRIKNGQREAVAERRYESGSLKGAVQRGGRSELALDLLDGLRISLKDTIVVAGPTYGNNKWFITKLIERNINFAVEVHPSSLVIIDAKSSSKTNVAALLPRVTWSPLTLDAPENVSVTQYCASQIANVCLPLGKKGRLFAGEAGAITGIHRGTIIGITSNSDAGIGDLLSALVWTRWIRPLVRRMEREALRAHPPNATAAYAQTTTNTAARVKVRANITLSSRQDQREGGAPSMQTPVVTRSILPDSIVNVVELFAGAGGMGLGFLMGKHPVKKTRIVFSGELHPIYVETLKQNYRKIDLIVGDVVAHRRTPSQIEALDLRTKHALDAASEASREAGGAHVVIGGPPCQGFSNANRNSWHAKNPNNQFIDVYLRYINRLQPRMFIMENVQGIIWTKKRSDGADAVSVADHLSKRLNALGYLVFPKLLDAAWYGVPQYRSRFFILGVRKDFGYHADDFGAWGPFPMPTHGPMGSRSYVTVRDAISDLPEIGNGHLDDVLQIQNQADGPRCKANSFLEFMHTDSDPDKIFDHVTSRHADYVIERYKYIPPGGNWQDIADKLTNYANVERTHSNIYRRLPWDQPSITIGHYRKSMLVHPSQHRGLSLREACRLQSFPDWFRFSGAVGASSRSGLMHKQQQLANAVCPLVAKAIAEYVLGL